MIPVSRVVNASNEELLCITYEIFLENIEKANSTLGEVRKKNIAKAVEVIKILTEDLNFEIPLSKELFRIYVYVQGVLVRPNVTSQDLEHIYGVMETVSRGFAEVAEKVEHIMPSMKNAETVYAGMTYGKSDLNEMVITNENRGFKA